MSRELVESILSKNMLEANDMVEATLAEIRERKIYEMKRMFQAEAFGGLTKAEIEARKKAGYKKASEVLGDPWAKKKNEKRLNPGAKIIKKNVSEETLDEAGLAPSSMRARLYKTGLKAIRDVEKKKAAADEKKKAETENQPSDLKSAMKARRSMKQDGKDTYVSGLKKRIGAELDAKSKKHTTASGKSAWERSVGGKTASLVGGPVSAVAKELGSIGFSNLE